MSVRRVLGVALAVMLLLPIAALAGLEEYTYQVNAPDMSYNSEFISEESSWNPPVIRGTLDGTFGRHEDTIEPYDLLPLVESHTFPDRVLDKDPNDGSTLENGEWYYFSFAEPVALRQFYYYQAQSTTTLIKAVRATFTVEANDGGQWVPYMTFTVETPDGNKARLSMRGDLEEFKGYFTYYRMKVETGCYYWTCMSAYPLWARAAGSIRFKGFTKQEVLNHIAQSQPIDIGYLSQITYLAASVGGEDKHLWPDGPPTIGFLFGDGSGNWYSVKNGQVVQTSLDRILTWIDGLSQQEIAQLSGAELNALKEALGDQMILAVFLPDPYMWFTWLKVNGYRFLLTEQDLSVDHTVQHQYAPATVTFSVDISGLPHGAYRPVTVNVDYGDGQTGQVSAHEIPLTFQHEYQEGGTYSAALEIVLADGQTLSVPVQVAVNDRAPASFNVSRQTEIDYMPADFQFTATVESPDERNAQLEGIPITWQIKHGDEVIEVLENQGLTLSRTFTEAGDYTVEVEATSPIGTPITGSVAINVKERAPATAVITAEPDKSYAPTPFRFAVEIDSPDPRNQKVDVAGIQYSVKDAAGNVLCEGNSADMQFSCDHVFDESDELYTVEVALTSVIGTEIASSAQFRAPERADLNVELKFDCINMKDGVPFIPTTCEVVPKIVSDDPRNYEVSEFFLAVMDSSGNVVAEIDRVKKVPFNIEAGKFEETYTITAHVRSVIDTVADVQTTLRAEAAAITGDIRTQTRDAFAPATYYFTSQLVSDDRRTIEDLVDLKYEVLRHGEDQVLATYITSSPKSKVQHTFEEGGHYVVRFTGKSGLTGVGFTMEKDLFVSQRAPVSVVITDRCSPSNPAMPPMQCEFRSRISSDDKRNREVTTETWEVFLGDQVIHDSHATKLKYTFEEPGTYVVRYTAVTGIGTEVTGVVNVTVLEAGGVEPVVSYKCNPADYTPTQCKFRMGLNVEDVRDRRVSSCRWEVLAGEEVIHSVSRPGGCGVLRYTFQDGGDYSIRLSGTTRLGKDFELVLPIDFDAHKEAELLILSRYRGHNRPPVTWKFYYKVMSEDKRQRRLGTISWTIADSSGQVVCTGSQPYCICTFTSAGEYTVRAEGVTRIGDPVEAETTISVNPNQPPKVVSFAVKPDRRNPLRIKHYTKVRDYDGKVRKIIWDFGDGSDTYGRPSGAHTYAEPGTYVLTLTACDDSGDCTVHQEEVTVGAQ